MTIYPEKHIPKLIKIFNTIKQDLTDRGHDEDEAHYHTLHFFSAFDADDYDKTKQKEWLDSHPDFRDWLESGAPIEEVDHEEMQKCLKILEVFDAEEEIKKDIWEKKPNFDDYGAVEWKEYLDELNRWLADLKYQCKEDTYWYKDTRRELDHQARRLDAMRKWYVLSSGVPDQ